MSNIIAQELKLAESKMIEEIHYKNVTLAKLTRDNVAIVEAMIRNDSAYIRSSDKNAAPTNKYQGSTAYWMVQLKKELFSKNTMYSYEDIIKNAVIAVDRENSTHLNADKCGRQEITKRICEFDKKTFIKCLKNPNYKDMLLVREISRKTSAKTKARVNASFASKFCHYACFYIFENTEYQDNYSIYDNVLKKVLKYYLDYYHITQKYNLEDYKDYRLAVDAIRTASGIEISRNGFDHLLWYYHKGRI